MAKSLLKLKARELRRQGISVKYIAEELHITKSSVSLWVRDIILSIEQLEALRKSSLQGAERGRLKSALLQKERRIKQLEEHKSSGIKTIGALTDRELLIAGLALYWGEGSKKDRKVQFCNADPQMVRFLLDWLQRCFGIELKELRCIVGINAIHIQREAIVKAYWSKITGIPLEQFTKTSFKKVTNQKVYDNFDNHYGTLSIKVMQPARLYGKILGLIEGLANTSQGSSMVEQSLHKAKVVGSNPTPGTK